MEVVNRLFFQSHHILQRKSVAINFLQSQLAIHPTLVLNNSIENLEYEFISSVYKVLNQKKPRIAFLKENGELDKFERSGIQDALEQLKVL